jgi:hypothetical protein
MWDIEHNEFYSNSGINNLVDIIMTHENLDATDRVLGDFISDDFMHLRLSHINSQKYEHLCGTGYRSDERLCDRNYAWLDR